MFVTPSTEHLTHFKIQSCKYVEWYIQTSRLPSCWMLLLLSCLAWLLSSSCCSSSRCFHSFSKIWLLCQDRKWCIESEFGRWLWQEELHLGFHTDGFERQYSLLIKRFSLSDIFWLDNCSNCLLKEPCKYQLGILALLKYGMVRWLQHSLFLADTVGLLLNYGL